jgi:tetratricopeptide (TPR) repeat protein
MSDSNKAVFLSYASQDAAAARSICDALRDAGIEVWFDQSELRGGDAWDQKIRKQIRECALFIPVISANTQARREGYFRREWKQAAARTYDIADGTPFLVPIVIDDTRDAEALVPEEFLAVQWTRLPAGEPAPAFGERVKKLLAGEATPASDRRGTKGGAVVAGRRSALPRWLVATAAIAVVALGFFVSRPGSKPEPVLRSLEAGQPAPTTAASSGANSGPVALTEARKLVFKARALHAEWAYDQASREPIILAEQFCKRAVELDPSDGEAWAIYSIITGTYVGQMWDASPERYELSRTQAEKARSLAPDSPEVQYALGSFYRFRPETRPEGEKVMRALVERAPDDPRFLRMLSLILGRQDKEAEAAEYRRRAAALPGGDPTAVILAATTAMNSGRVAEGDAILERALTARSPGIFYLYFLNVCRIRGDLDQARALIPRMPPSVLLAESGISNAAMVWFWSREPEKLLATLGNTSSEFLTPTILSQAYDGPKGFLSGWAHELAGRPTAAQAEWRLALQAVERRLKTEPNSAANVRAQLMLLACLGQREEALRALHLYQQLQKRPEGEVSWDLLTTLGRLGRVDEVLDFLERQKVNPVQRVVLRLSPTFDFLRAHPRFRAVVEAPPGNSTQIVPEITLGGGAQFRFAPVIHVRV